MNVGWLVVAMGAAALCIGGYVALLLFRMRRIQSNLSELRDRIPPT
jgi:hypothetical protein